MELLNFTTSKILPIVLVIVLPIWGIAKCFKLLKRTNVSPLCVLALLIFLITLEASAISNLASPLSQNFSHGGRRFLQVLIILSFFTGMILGIVGLAMFKSTEDSHPRGKTQGVWGVILNAAFTSLTAFMFVNALAGFKSNGGIIAQFSAPNPPETRTTTNPLNEDKKPNFTVSKPVQDVEKHPWGFTTHLAELGWLHWSLRNEDFPTAVFAAHHGPDAYVGVVPMPTAGLAIDMPTAAGVLVSTFGVSLQDAISQKTISLSYAEEAIELIFKKQSNGLSLHYTCRIAKTPNRYLLLLGWINQAEHHPENLLSEALDAIKIVKMETLPENKDITLDHRNNMSALLHQCGLIAFDRQETELSSKIFQASFALSKNNPRTLESAVYTLRSLGQVQAAIKLLEDNKDVFPQDLAIQFQQLRLEHETQVEGSLSKIVTLFGAGYRVEDDLAWAMGELIRTSRAEDAVKLLTNYLKKPSSPRVRRWLAIAHEQSGDVKKAVEILETLFNEPPFDVETAYRFGETANLADEYDKASKVVARLIKEGHDGARTRLIAGWAQGGRKEWREAKASFEQAAKAAPNDPLVTEAIARASAALGEGDNSSLKNPIPALEIPSDMQSIIAKAHALPPPDGAGAQYLHRLTLLKFSKDQPLVTTIHRALRLLDVNSIADLSTLAFPFDPLSEEIYVNSVIVKNPDGSEAARVKPEEQYLIDESSQSAMATQRKILRIALPGLKVGRTVHLTLTRREKTTEPTFPWQRLIMSSAVPTNLEAVVVLADQQQFQISGNAKFNELASIKKTPGVWQASISAPPQYYQEVLMPMVDSFMPVLHLGDAAGSWKSLGEEYLKDIGDRLAPESSVTALAEKLTAGASTELEKVQALARHVQKEITYQGLEFGRRARRPNLAGSVLSNHYGDCKDQSLLLHKLLQAAKVKSHLALVSTDHDAVDGIPSLDQFNHMIVHVPTLPCKFIDTTSTRSPVGQLPPDLALSRAFIIDAEGSRLVEFPAEKDLPPDEINIAREVSFDASGNGISQETMTITGYYAVGFRDYLGSLPKDQRLAAYQRSQRETTAQLEELDVQGLEENHQPLVLKLRYRIPTEHGEIRLPAVSENNTLGTSFTTSRKHPFRYFHALKLESKTTIKTATPLATKALAGIKQQADTPFLKWEVTSSGTDSITFKAIRPFGEYPAKQYNELFEASQSALKALTKPLK